MSSGRMRNVLRPNNGVVLFTVVLTMRFGENLCVSFLRNFAEFDFPNTSNCFSLCSSCDCSHSIKRNPRENNFSKFSKLLCAIVSSMRVVDMVFSDEKNESPNCQNAHARTYFPMRTTFIHNAKYTKNVYRDANHFE